MDGKYCNWMNILQESENHKYMKKVGIVACSDAQKEEYRK